MIDISSYVDTFRQVDGYMGCILIGSCATGYDTADSDVDMHVFIYGDTITKGFVKQSDTLINYVIWPLSVVRRRLDDALKTGSKRLFVMYGFQGKILDDPSGILQEMKDDIVSLEDDRPLGYTALDVFSWKKTIIEYSDMVIRRIGSDDPYDRIILDRYLGYILEKYGRYVGYGCDFSFSRRYKASKLLHDQDYAEHHWGVAFPDQVFVDLWGEVVSTPSRDGIQRLSAYVVDKMGGIDETGDEVTISVE